MTWAEVVRILKRKGCKFRRHDKRHDVYYNPKLDGEPEAEIPRHKSQEAKNGTVMEIFKKLGIK